MRIEGVLTDDAILAELGQRLQRHRLDQNVTQAQVAREAGLSTPTVQRVEAGSSVQLASLLRVMRVLGLLDQVEGLVPQPGVRPMELLQRGGRRRQRASSGKSDPKGEPWSWED
ncbi:MAG: helix-turn-helix transcriptional regulator [Pseudomonadota bacterium]